MAIRQDRRKEDSGAGYSDHYFGKYCFSKAPTEFAHLVMIGLGKGRGSLKDKFLFGGSFQ